MLNFILGQTCYCGNSLTNTTTLTSQNSSAVTACTGNSTQACGGNSVLQLYASPVIVQQVGTFTYQGLYNDPSSSILVAANESTSSMTVATCASFCSGYTYFGVENGRSYRSFIFEKPANYYLGTTCVCGNTLMNSSSLVSANSSSGIGCFGNSSQLCGGSSVLQLYASPVIVQSIGLYSFQGLYSDPTNSLLVAANESTNGMTVATCASFCSNYTYFGVENGIFNFHYLFSG